MGLPSKLKNMNLFQDGVSYIGQVTEVTLPKLMIKSESYRAGGMIGEIAIDQGLDKLELEYTAGGLLLPHIRKFGAVQHDAVLTRFAGAFQSDGTGRVQSVEVIVRGRHMEIDMGSAKPGSDTEHKFKASLSYYKLAVDGRTEIEIDVLNGVFIVDGNDRYAEIRAAIG